MCVWMCATLSTVVVSAGCEHDVNVATPMQRLAAWLAHPSAMRPALFGMRFTFYYEPVSEVRLWGALERDKG